MEIVDIKLAQSIAEEIEREIVSHALPLGHNLGNEAELLVRFGASRSVLREAITLIERSGLAKVRRGNVGGLLVRAPSPERIADDLRNYLEFVTTETEDLISTRLALEETAVNAAMKNLDEAGLDNLLGLVARFDATTEPQDFARLAFEMMQAILVIAGNPCLKVFSLALATLAVNKLGVIPVMEQTLVRRAETVCACRRDQLIAIIAADQVSALKATVRHYDLYRELLAESELETAVDENTTFEEGESLLLSIGLGRSTPRLAETVARRIRDRVLRTGMKAGDRLGSEVDLLKEYGVGRGVIREAIRILERLSIAEPCRGKHGGLRVAAPDLTAVVHSVSAYLISLGVQHRDLLQVGDALDILGAAMAAQRVPQTDPDTLRLTLRRLAEIREGSSLAEVSSAYYTLVGDLSGNKPLAILMGVLAELHSLIENDAADVRIKSLDEERIRELFAAIADGNVALARRRMLLLRRYGARLRAAPIRTAKFV